MMTLVLALSPLTMPAFANMITWDWSEHHTPLKHAGLMVLAYTEGTVIGSDKEQRTHMTVEQMDELVTAERVVLVFFLAEDAEEWTLLLAQKGTDVFPEFPGNGTYAVGVTW